MQFFIKTAQGPLITTVMFTEQGKGKVKAKTKTDMNITVDQNKVKKESKRANLCRFTFKLQGECDLNNVEKHCKMYFRGYPNS